MNPIHLLPIGNVDAVLLRDLPYALAEELQTRCDLLTPALDAEFAYHPERQQYHSTEILVRLASLRRSDSWRLVGITALDLYIPILTFVFGEAEINGSCAVVSLHRLRQEFYGLPPDPALLRERIVKETVHELGHTFRLTHCDDYSCVMASSHSVEWIDLKTSGFCRQCAAALAARWQAKDIG
jgi:archaemetzincin